MGINVTAYRQISPRTAELADGVDPIDPVTKEYIGDTCFMVEVNDRFPEYAEHLQQDCVYGYAEKVHVISTAYMHYSELRQELTRMVGYRPGVAGPFSEWLDLKDSEATIGPVTAAKLTWDFKRFDDQARASQFHSFYLIYTNFWRGFEAAADNGAITFG